MRARTHFVDFMFLVLSKAISLIFAIQRLEPAGMGKMEREREFTQQTKTLEPKMDGESQWLHAELEQPKR